MNTVAIQPALEALRDAQKRMAEIQSKLSALQTSYRTLLKITQQPEPDIDGILADLVGALADGNEAQMSRLKTALDDAKDTKMAIVKAQGELSVLQAEIAEEDAEYARLTGEIHKLNYDVVRGEFDAEFAGYQETFNDLLSRFIRCREIGLALEAFANPSDGRPFMVPGVFKGATTFEVPSPKMGSHPSRGAVLFARISNNDALVLAARAEIEAWAQTIAK